MRMLKLNLLILASVVTLTGCATGAKFSGVRQGMTADQVEQQLGAPDGVQQLQYVKVYQYKNRMVSGFSYDKADYFVVIGLDDNKVRSYDQENYREAVRAPMPTVAPASTVAPMPTTITCDSTKLGATTFTDCSAK